MNAKDLYDKDLNLWVISQLRTLKKLRNLDIENLIEEIGGIIRSDRRRLKSNVEGLMATYIKWKFCPTNRKYSWYRDILEHRILIHSTLDTSPSLKGEIKHCCTTQYVRAVELAQEEEGLTWEPMPVKAQFDLEDLMREPIYFENGTIV